VKRIFVTCLTLTLPQEAASIRVCDQQKVFKEQTYSCLLRLSAQNQLLTKHVRGYSSVIEELQAISNLKWKP